MTTTRRAMYVTRTGGPEVLALREEPVGSPGKGEVLVEVAYSGVNFADLAARAGLYPEAPKTPMVLGYELSGHVAALGPGVDTLEVGGAVVAARRFGAYASHAV